MEMSCLSVSFCLQSLYFSPSVLVYFVFFLQIMAQIWLLLLALSAVRMMIHYLPIAALYLIWRRKLLCNGFNIQINEAGEHRITAQGMGIGGYARYYLAKKLMGVTPPSPLLQRAKTVLSNWLI